MRVPPVEVTDCARPSTSPAYLELADDGGQRLALFHGTPGSPSAAALGDLATRGALVSA